MNNVAIFGGSFDPPHTGHLAIMQKALETLDIDKLIIVPAYLNPFKSHAHAPASLRLKWLKRICSGIQKIEVSDFEIRQGRPVPSVETVRHVSGKADHIYLIIGADNLETLAQWHAYDELNAMVEWVVAKRGNIRIPEGYMTLEVDEPVSSTSLRKTIDHLSLPSAVAEEIAMYYKENNATKN